MGERGTCHRTVGLPAVRRAVRRLAILAIPALLLAACSSAGELLGAAGGSAAAVGSANPAVGIAVGVSIRAVADWGMRAVMLRWHRTEQDALAATVGAMQEGEVRPWEVRHDLPIGDEQGDVHVLRVIDTPLARCKEALFSITSGSEPDITREWYLTSVCQQAGGWKWAAAEPATGRWDSLQ